MKCNQCGATPENCDYLTNYKGGLVLCCDCDDNMKSNIKKSLKENPIRVGVK